jgi:protein-tyrosine kinase
LHIPKQHIINGLDNEVGLSMVLRGQMNLTRAMQQTKFPGMHVLTSGPLPPNPDKMLGSSQMKSLLNQLSEQYDMVLLDTPALLVFADTALLAPIVDGVLFVARRNFIQEEAVREACKQLAYIKAPLVGLVVNEAEKNGASYYDRYR